MSKAGPAQLERARRLLAHEVAADRAPGPASTAASRVYDKLYSQMAPLVGDSGVHMLFMRSAALAKGEFARLSVLSAPEASKQLRESLQAPRSAAATESDAALFGNLFSLMNIFIGERLTSQVLRGAWPAFEEAAPTEKHK